MELPKDVKDYRNTFSAANWNHYDNTLVPAEVGWIESRLIELGFNEGYTFASNVNGVYEEQLRCAYEAIEDDAVTIRQLKKQNDILMEFIKDVANVNSSFYIKNSRILYGELIKEINNIQIMKQKAVAVLKAIS